VISNMELTGALLLRVRVERLVGRELIHTYQLVANAQ